jgi:hypothetical protein
MECIIYMGSEDVRRQALNVFRIEMLGGKVSSTLCFIDIRVVYMKFLGHPSQLWFVYLERRRK